MQNFKVVAQGHHIFLIEPNQHPHCQICVQGHIWPHSSTFELDIWDLFLVRYYPTSTAGQASVVGICCFFLNCNLRDRPISQVTQSPNAENKNRYKSLIVADRGLKMYKLGAKSWNLQSKPEPEVVLAAVLDSEGANSGKNAFIRCRKATIVCTSETA